MKCTSCGTDFCLLCLWKKVEGSSYCGYSTVCAPLLLCKTNCQKRNDNEANFIVVLLNNTVQLQTVLLYYYYSIILYSPNNGKAAKIL